MVPSTHNLSVQYGTSATTTIIFNPGTGATNYTLQLAATGLPGGITAAFSPNPTPPGTASTLTLTAPAVGPIEDNVPVTLTATRSTDSLQASANVMVSALPAASSITSSRTDFVRTDDTPSSVAYDSAHAHIFVCNPHLSRVDVVSTSSHQIVKSLLIPGAERLTLTPDNSRAYVGGPMQKLVAIDTASLAVVAQYLYPQYNGNYIDPAPIAVANGLVLLLGYGSTGFGFFNPATGAITQGSNSNNCMLGDFYARSGDGTKVLVAADSYPGAISLIDVASATCTASFQYESPAFAPAVNADGSQFAVGSDALYFLSPNLSILGTVPVSGYIGGMIYSPDGQLLYIVSEPIGGYLPTISTVDTQTFSIVGTAPSMGFGPATLETPGGVNSTGMIFGAANYGLVFDDSTYYQNFSASASYPTTFNGKPRKALPTLPLR